MKKKADQLHIGIFGRTNVGKSSLINALTQQELAIVSDFKGTTTDPVKKSIEILGVGNVVLIDTAGIDDESVLGKQRLEKTEQALTQIDLAIVVVDHYRWDDYEKEVVEKLTALQTPYFVVNNKSDLLQERETQIGEGFSVIHVDTLSFEGVEPLVEALKQWIKSQEKSREKLLDGYISENQTVVLVTPIDSEAPEGRMILPQVQMIRNILDNFAISVVLRETQLAHYLETHPAPDLVVTDSQAFKLVNEIVPKEVPLTSFSIVLAHEKGDFQLYLESLNKVKTLKDGDKILILESCTHHSSCEDIGRVKIPNWLQKYTGKNFEFVLIPHLQPIENPEQYALAVQCGGCMVTEKQLQNRIMTVKNAGVPVTNYGLLIAFMNGIIERARFF